MKIARHRRIILVWVSVLLAIFFKVNAWASDDILPTYFQYSEQELASLKTINPSSSQLITPELLQKWDTTMFDLVGNEGLGEKDAILVYTYVYVAQRDAAFITQNLRGSLNVDIDFVTGKILCVFFEKSCHEFASELKTDLYSQHVTDMIINKIKIRMAHDQQQRTLSSIKSGKEYWVGVKPYYGQDVGSRETWLIKSIDQLNHPPPPLPYNDPKWNDVLAITVNARTNATDEQKIKVVFWAGGPGTITPAGQWLVLANDYIWQQHTLTMTKILLIRSTLAMTIADSIIAVFREKYTHWVKRPFMRDNTLQTIMPTPNHPSYPAAHSTISAAAATLLSYYFPENKQFWQLQATEAGMSRIWGGIHFITDNEAGNALGEQVANHDGRATS